MTAPTADGLVPDTPASEVLDTQGLADYLGISRERARMLLRTKAIRSKRLPGGEKAEYRTTITWVREWMDADADGGPALPPPAALARASRRRH